MSTLFFECSLECKKCGSKDINKGLYDTYKQGRVRHLKDAEEFLQCNCKTCGYYFFTFTKDYQHKEDEK